MGIGTCSGGGLHFLFRLAPSPGPLVSGQMARQVSFLGPGAAGLIWSSGGSVCAETDAVTPPLPPWKLAMRPSQSLPLL